MTLVALFAFLAFALAFAGYSDGDTGLAAFGTILGVLLGLAFLYLRREASESRRFLEWLVGNRKMLLDGGTVLYEGKIIRRDTPLTQFQTCVSFLVATTKVPSRLLVVGEDGTAGHAVRYSLVALLLGWWGIPWGPIWTVSSLVSNLRGGMRTTVGQLLAPAAA